MITIIPTVGSNLNSICSALDRLELTWQISEDPKEITNSEKVILPGVGHAETAMAKLKAKGLEETVRSLSQLTLGICLGMQLLFEESEESDEGAMPVRCLSIIPGRVKEIAFKPGMSLPHMGWNQVKPAGNSAHWQAEDVEDYYYFVHGYYCENGPWVKAVTDYVEAIPAIVEYKNFVGMQFHPEKSSTAGLELLRSYLS
ncbi:MAG: imidazole glycerol phosphate synthase subunit HisH [Oligoflexales bacterium]|nr:imidazole glycerol phosphate synthase subunit HisH [Oligoflexales bacterium]